MNAPRLNPILVEEGAGKRPAAVAGDAPPRRTKRAAAFSRGPAMRRLAVGLVLTAVFGVVAARSSAVVFRPLAVAHHADVESTGLRRQLAGEAATQRRLRERLRYLRTPTGVEEEARRLGWVRGGETALMILRPETTPATSRAQSRPTH